MLLQAALVQAVALPCEYLVPHSAQAPCPEPQLGQVLPAIDSVTDDLFVAEGPGARQWLHESVSFGAVQPFL